MANPQNDKDVEARASLRSRLKNHKEWLLFDPSTFVVIDHKEWLLFGPLYLCSNAL